jgi:signal transduction histidine kinase/ActR/RegA family two-component response regulator
VDAVIPHTPRAVARARLPILFGVVAAIIAVIIALLAQLQNDREAWVRHTLEVEQALSELNTSVYRAEAFERGFLITGQANFSQIYDRERAGIPVRLTELQALTGDNSEQRGEIPQLRASVQRKLAEMDRALALRRSGDTRAAFVSLSDGDTRQRSVEVARTINRMRATEARLLVQRTRESEELNLALLVAVALTGVIVLGFAALWVGQARRAGQALGSAYRELSVINAELMAEMGSRAAAESQVRQMQKMEAIGQLTGGIAHDFNNMLAVVIGNMNMIQRRLAKGDKDIGRFVEAALEGAGRAATLTGRLLAFSRQQPLSPEPIEPNRLVSGMSELLTRTLGETVEVETVLGAGLWRTKADPTQLESALVNLAVNGRDAMPEGGRLTIETANTYLDADYAAGAGAEAGQYVMIAVTDTGCGMAREVIDKALDPFFTTKPVGKGTGLGLSQVYGFVKQSGGHLRIYSEPGQGTTVKIYLPRLVGEAAPAEPAKTVLGAPSDQRYKVLLVEDDERVRAFAEAALRELGYAVASAENAAEALQRFAAEPEVDLLLTDVVMPDINGRQLAEKIQQTRPDLPVLYMTGFTRNAVVHNGLLDPGVNLMSKPFTIDQLATKVRQAIEGNAVKSI